MAEGKEHFNKASYERNYRRVFKRGHKLPAGRYVFRNGRFVPHDPTASIPPELVAKDNVNIRSLASGVVSDQVAEATRRFGHLGVKFDPVTGDAIYKDRASKLRVLKERGFFDRDEVRG